MEHLAWLINRIKHCTCHGAALTLSSSVSLVACMSWVSSSDILSVVRISISSSRALSYNTDNIALTSRHPKPLSVHRDSDLSSFRGWPVRCVPAVRPHAPARLLCSQHPPAGPPHLTRCPGKPGSEPAASRSLFASDANTQTHTIMTYYRNKW